MYQTLNGGILQLYSVGKQLINVAAELNMRHITILYHSLTAADWTRRYLCSTTQIRLPGASKCGGTRVSPSTNQRKERKGKEEKRGYLEGEHDEFSVKALTSIARNFMIG